MSAKNDMGSQWPRIPSHLLQSLQKQRRTIAHHEVHIEINRLRSQLADLRTLSSTLEPELACLYKEHAPFGLQPHVKKILSAGHGQKNPILWMALAKKIGFDVLSERANNPLCDGFAVVGPTRLTGL